MNKDRRNKKIDRKFKKIRRKCKKKIDRCVVQAQCETVSRLTDYPILN